MVWTGLTAVDTSTSDLDFTLILGTTRALIPGVSAMFTSLAAIKVRICSDVYGMFVRPEISSELINRVWMVAKPTRG